MALADWTAWPCTPSFSLFQLYSPTTPTTYFERALLHICLQSKTIHLREEEEFTQKQAPFLLLGLQVVWLHNQESTGTETR